MSAPTKTSIAMNLSPLDMAASLGKRPNGRHPFVRPAAKLRIVADALGCSDALAEKKLWGPHALPIESAKTVAALLRHGLTEDVALFLAPIEAARSGEPTMQDVDAILAAAMADCHEDTAEARYQANPCRETAKAWLAASAIERARGLERDAELRAKWEID